MKKVLLFLLICTMCTSIFAGNIYVNSSTGSDTNNGTKNSPYKTITKALSMAVANDSVLVNPGTYDYLTTGESFPILMKSGVKLVSIKGAYYTIISANGADTNVMNIINTNSNTLVKGFSIRYGKSIGNSSQFLNIAKGGGVQFLNYDSSHFECNIVEYNQAIGYQGTLTGTNTVGGDAEAGGIFLESYCETIIRNCIVRNNLAYGGPGRGYGGGFSGDPTLGGRAKGGGVLANSGYLYHNIIYGNTAYGGPGGVTNSSITPNLGNGGEGRGGGFYSYSSSAKVENNIFMANEARGGLAGSISVNGSGDYGAAYTFAGFDHNLFYQNTASTSDNTGFTGMNPYLELNPFIHSSTNFHLQSNSNAIAHGKTNTGVQYDFDGAIRSSTAPTIGPYEMTAFTPTELFEKDSLTLGINVFGNTRVSTNLSIVPGIKSKSVRVHFFNSGRTGKINNVLSSNFYWSISTTSDSIFGTITFNYSNLNLKLDTASIKLYKRQGQNTPWEEVLNTTRNGKTITAQMNGFSEYALGSGDTTVKVGLNHSKNIENDLVILPNPNNGNFKIAYTSDFYNKNIIIYDQLGKVVKSLVTPINTDITENINLPQGFYFIKIDLGVNTITKKVIVY